MILMMIAIIDDDDNTQHLQEIAMLIILGVN